VKEYNIKIIGLGLMMGLSTWLADVFSAKVAVPMEAYLGIVYMTIIFWALRYYVSKSSISNPNQWVRRAMTSSMLRLLAVLTFLLITLINKGKADLVFACVYCLCFILFLLFEMSEKRSNLRPDSNNGPQKENA
jgi:Ca2+/Na+ antiporter